MIINLTYANKTSSKIISKKVKKALGIKGNSQVFEYDGMLFSVNKNNIKINTLMDNDHDMRFLGKLIESVFHKSIIGISGFGGEKGEIKASNNTIIWM